MMIRRKLFDILESLARAATIAGTIVLKIVLEHNRKATNGSLASGCD